MFIVTTIHNFDPSTDAVVFDTYEEAEAYLNWIWKTYYDEEVENESDLVEDECYLDPDGFGKIEWTDGNQTWFNLLESSSPYEGFKYDPK